MNIFDNSNLFPVPMALSKSRNDYITFEKKKDVCVYI